jgi:hypothetical protein
MRPISSTLTELIVFAEGVITRPNGNHDWYERLNAIAVEVRYADALPAENIRTTRAALIMTVAIEEFRDSDRYAGSQWLILAGAVLPILRAEAYVALQNEKKARAEG